MHPTITHYKYQAFKITGEIKHKTFSSSLAFTLPLQNLLLKSKCGKIEWGTFNIGDTWKLSFNKNPFELSHLNTMVNYEQHCKEFMKEEGFDDQNSYMFLYKDCNDLKPFYCYLVKS